MASAVPPDAAKADKAKPKAPAKGSPEEELLPQVQVEKGLKVEVWASEPLMANPVSFCFDEKGRVLRRRDDAVRHTASRTPAAT